MKITRAQRTTMPFDGGLSPVTDKSRVVPQMGGGPHDKPRRNFDRNMGGDHKFIDTNNPDDKSYAVMNGLYEHEGDVKMLVDADVYYIVETKDGKSLTIDDLSFEQIIKKYPGASITKRQRRVEKRVASASNKKPNFMTLVSNILASTFKVEADSEKFGKREIGSCFCVAPATFMTCAHVVSRRREDPSSIIIDIIDGEKRYRATVEDIDYDMDIALLSCDSIRTHPMEMKSMSDVMVGNEIVCVGSPYGYDNEVSTGIISSKDRVIDSDSKIAFFFMDLSLYPGSSGGPVIDTEDGRVVGLAAVIVQSVGNYGLNAAIPIEYASERFGKLF